MRRRVADLRQEVLFSNDYGTKWHAQAEHWRGQAAALEASAQATKAAAAVLEAGAQATKAALAESELELQQTKRAYEEVRRFSPCR